jgi:membrane-associated protease RseP (regulator of RpoE activity)
VADTDDRHETVEKGTDWVRLALIVGVTVFFATRVGLSVILIILSLIFMIFMHELGHYLTAKAAGMKVTEFFIGFGPRLWSFRRGETEYGLKPIPAGAYVKIIGMSNLEEVDPADEARTYRQQPYWRRMSVAVAGSAMHFVMALLLVFGTLVAFGLPDPDSDVWVIDRVTRPSPAFDAGLRPGDQILEVDGRRVVDDFRALSAYLQDRPGESVELLVERDGEERTIEPTLADRHPDAGTSVGFLGVAPASERIQYGPFDGAARAVELTGTTMWESVKGLASIFSPSGISGYIDNLTSAGDDPAEDGGGEGVQPEDGNRFISPIGVVQLADSTWQSGAADFLFFLFAINIFIGLFNLVPLLPFDGGHVAIATYERIREIGRGGRRYFADVSKLLPLTYAVFLVLGFIFLSSLFLDLADPIQLQ